MTTSSARGLAPLFAALLLLSACGGTADTDQTAEAATAETGNDNPAASSGDVLAELEASTTSTTTTTTTTTTVPTTTTDPAPSLEPNIGGLHAALDQLLGSTDNFAATLEPLARPVPALDMADMEITFVRISFEGTRADYQVFVSTSEDPASVPEQVTAGVEATFPDLEASVVPIDGFADELFFTSTELALAPGATSEFPSTLIRLSGLGPFEDGGAIMAVNGTFLEGGDQVLDAWSPFFGDLPLENGELEFASFQRPQNESAGGGGTVRISHTASVIDEAILSIDSQLRALGWTVVEPFESTQGGATSMYLPSWSESAAAVFISDSQQDQILVSISIPRS